MDVHHMYRASTSMMKEPSEMSMLQLRTEDHSGLSRLVVDLGTFETPDDRDRLLVEGIEDLIRGLVATTTKAKVGVAIDIRVSDSSSRGPRAAGGEAFIAACHGIVHAYVAEEREAIVPVNLVVSFNEQGEDRETTLDYLASPGGSFSRGSMIDLRGVA
jgi:hypothetical protein